MFWNVLWQCIWRLLGEHDVASFAFVSTIVDVFIVISFCMIRPSSFRREGLVIGSNFLVVMS
jgi:hypothetical protein